MTTEGRIQKIFSLLAAAGLIIGFFSSPTISQAAINCQALVSANNSSLSFTQLQQKQTCLSQLQTQYQNQINQSKKQASDIQGAIGSLNSNIASTNNQISNTQDQIATTEAVLTTLATQIQTTQQQLDDLNTKLKGAYSNIYELSQTSTLEMILGSKSINDLLNQTQYVEALQTQLQSGISQANTLNNNLNSQKQVAEQQRANLQSLNSQLNGQKASLSTQISSQSILLTQTQQQQANEQKQLKVVNDQAAITQQVINQLLAASKGSSEGGSGGYPWDYGRWIPCGPSGSGCWAVDGSGNPIIDYGNDPNWAFYARNCTSYAAWFWLHNESLLGKGNGPAFMNGNANNWASAARAAHLSVDHTSPRVGDIVAWSVGGYGHVAIVQGVNSNGTIFISQYNIGLDGHYSTQTVRPDFLGTPSFIHLP